MIKTNNKLYENNFISEIDLKIDFMEINSTEYNEGFSNFKNIVEKEFPGISDFINMTSENNFDNTSTNNIEKTWLFRNNDKKQLILNINSILLQYDGQYYNSFETILSDLELIIKALNEYNIKTINNIELRYINEIKELIPDFNDFLDSKYKGLFEDEKIIRSMNSIDFYEDVYILKFTYGQFNLNYPNKNISPDYVLDYKCNLPIPVSLNNLEKNVKVMHKIIIKYFENSISDMLRNKLGEKNDE